MMRYIFVFLALGLSFYVKAQSVESLQKEIDQFVWKPFKNAFETIDGIALNSIYADEVLRVTPDGIDTNNTFKSKNLERFIQNKKDGVSITLDFWFDSRHTNKTTSYEVGFFRIGFTSIEGKTNYSYGQFHIVLKKINGTWKITQDWDTATINGETIGAEDFEKQRPIRF